MNNELQTRVKELQEWLEIWVVSNGKTWSQTAKEIGISAAAISRFRDPESNTFQTAGICDRIEAYRRLSQAREYKVNIGFVETGIAGRVIKVAKYCHTNSCIGVIEGPSGCGKSTAALKFQQTINNGLIHYVRTRPGSTRNAFLRDMLFSVSPKTQRKFRDAMETEIINRINENHMFVIDQFHDAPADCVDELMMLHDVTTCSMCLIGTRRVNDVLYGQSQHEQMLDRIGFYHKIEPKQNSDGVLEFFSIEEIQQIASNTAEGITTSAVTWMYTEANKRGSLRLAMRVFTLALGEQPSAEKITSITLQNMMRLSMGAKANASVA